MGAVLGIDRRCNSLVESRIIEYLNSQRLRITVRDAGRCLAGNYPNGLPASRLAERTSSPS